MTFFKVTLTEKLDLDKAIETAPVSEAQAAAYLGDLMVYMGRADAAERERTRSQTCTLFVRSRFRALSCFRGRALMRVTIRHFPRRA